MDTSGTRRAQSMGPFADRINCNNDQYLSGKEERPVRREDCANTSSHPDKLVKHFFDFLSKFLPLSLLALLVTIIIYGISFVMDKNTLQSVTKVVGIVLIILVIPSALLFWAKTVCTRPDSCCAADDHDSLYMIPI